MFAATGHIGEARKLLATLNEMVNQGSTYPTFAGLIYVGLGQRSKALAALEENAKIAGIGGVFLYDAFDELKDDPRYQSLIAEMQQ